MRFAIVLLCTILSLVARLTASLKFKLPENNLLEQSWNGYSDLLTTAPISTKMSTSAVGFLIGDTLAQILNAKVKKERLSINPKRLFIMSSFGLFIHGPFCHFLFNFLEHTWAGKEVSIIITKVLVDQLFFCPIISTIFLMYVNILQGKSLTQLGVVLREDLPIAMITSWKVWSLVHITSYLFVPLKFRVLYINIIQIFYSIFLSMLGNKERPKVNLTSESTSSNLSNKTDKPF